MKGLIIENKTDCEILSKKIIKFSQEKVFEAWENPSILQFWWGPNGFTNLFLEHHFVENGKWNFVMFSPEGKEYINECVFLSIKKPEFIAWDYLSKPLLQVQVSFKKITETSTEIICKTIFESKMKRDKLLKIVLTKNEEMLNKLEIEMIKIFH